MLDILIKNTIVKSIVSFVNFCNEQRYYNNHELKFFKKMPINNISKEDIYKNKFLFTNSMEYKVGTK